VTGRLAQRTKAEYLEAAAVGENAAVPVHERMKPPCFGYQFMSWPQKQMISIAENNSCSHISQLLGRHGFNRRLGAYRHKNGCVEDAMRSEQSAGPGAGFRTAFD